MAHGPWASGFIFSLSRLSILLSIPSFFFLSHTFRRELDIIEILVTGPKKKTQIKRTNKLATFNIFCKSVYKIISLSHSLLLNEFLKKESNMISKSVQLTKNCVQ